MRNFSIILISLAIPIFSCSEEEQWDCIQSNGEMTAIEIVPDSAVRIIKVFDDINLFLHNGDTPRIELLTGDNLLSDIRWELDTGALHIFNDNACKWVREPDNVELHVYSPQYNFFDLNGYGTMSTVDTLRHSFRFRTNGSGSADLLINAGSVSMEIYSLFNVKISGRVNSAGFYMNTGRDGRIDGSKLISNRTSIWHDGYNDIIAHPVSTLSYGIRNFGNIILVNEPSEIIQVEKTGKGTIIRKF